jgi:shikimate kinase
LVIYVKRSLKDLAVNGRPLSEKNGIEALFEQRKEKYASWCDMEVENAASPEVCVQEILKNIMEQNRK